MFRLRSNNDDDDESVIFVPATPHSELQKMYRSEIINSGLKIRTVERAGKSMKSILQRSDPFTPKDCGKPDCLVCQTGGEGPCRAPSVTYQIRCVVCGEDFSSPGSAYEGETSRNCYCRGKEHIRDLENKKDSSPLWRHTRDKHSGVVPEYQMSVTGNYKNDAMMRQIMESVRINNCSNEVLMNSKNEWHNFQLAEINLGGRNANRQ